MATGGTYLPLSLLFLGHTNPGTKFSEDGSARPRKILHTTRTRNEERKG